MRGCLPYGLTIMLAALLALILNLIWDLPPRWCGASVIGLMLVFLSLLFIRSFATFLFLFFMFIIPFAGFTQFYYPKDFDRLVQIFAIFSGTIGIGITDFVLAPLYILWFIRIFVTREDPLPRLQRSDWPVLLLLVAYGCSLMGNVSSYALGLLALAHLIKHVLLYLYVSRNTTRRHLRWVVRAAFFALLLEACLGLLQTQTGLFGNIMTAQDPEKSLSELEGPGLGSEQGFVPGIEGIFRAAGTTRDPHALGLYLAMLLPYVFLSLFAPCTTGLYRLISSLVLLLGIAVLVVTYSRSAWLSCAFSLCLAWGILLLWRERGVLPPSLVVLAVVLLLAPWAAGILYTRLVLAPHEIMMVRYEQYAVARDIWLHHPIFGCGVGNYIYAMRTYAPLTEMDFLPHNVFLWIGLEMGLLGVLAFFGIIFAAILRLATVIRAHRHPDCRIALAILTGLIAYLLDGLTDPLFREPVVYTMFWYSIGLSVVLRHLEDEEPARASAPSPAPTEGIPGA